MTAQPNRLGTGDPQGGIIAVLFRRLTMKYKIRLEETDEGFAVWVPGLPGCWSQGETEDEALENIKDAIKTYLETVEILLQGEQSRIVEVPV
jgi:predicted RNase H-like HicB family nuclease